MAGQGLPNRSPTPGQAWTSQPTLAKGTKPPQPSTEGLLFYHWLYPKLIRSHRYPNSQPHHHTTPHNLGLCRASPEGVKPKTPRRCRTAEALGEAGAPGSPPPADASHSLCSSLLEAGQRYTHSKIPCPPEGSRPVYSLAPSALDKQQWKEERGTNKEALDAAA